MKRSSKRGFTLVEIILALAILGILAAGFLPVFTNAFIWITQSGRRSEQVHAAQDTSEDLIMQGTTTSTDPLSFSFVDEDGENLVPVQINGEYIQNDTISIFMPSD